jgi:transcriptional regulator with XRE-family HTH domain
MVHDSDTIATLVQVAQLYYNQNKSQQEIADQLGVSRSLIALLKQSERITSYGSRLWIHWTSRTWLSF